MSYCTDRVVVKTFPQSIHVATLPCRSWTCESCRPRRRQRLIREASDGLPTKLLTLTSHTATAATPQLAARALSAAWRVIRLRLMRRLKLKALPFLTVMERTKNGWPHLHILMRAPYIDQRLISGMAAELLRAPIVDIRQVRSRNQAAGYVAKYVGKAPAAFPGCKRYWSSRDWRLPIAGTPRCDDAQAPLITCERLTIAAAVRRYAALGMWIILNPQNTAFWALPAKGGQGPP